MSPTRSGAWSRAWRARAGWPWLGVYSDSADSGAIARLREAAAGSSGAPDVVVYPKSGYRFDNDPASGADAWNRVLNWFDSHLR